MGQFLLPPSPSPDDDQFTAVEPIERYKEGSSQEPLVG